jgi:hypothetical protein
LLIPFFFGPVVSQSVGRFSAWDISESKGLSISSDNGRYVKHTSWCYGVENHFLFWKLATSYPHDIMDGPKKWLAFCLIWEGRNTLRNFPAKALY